ncbi:MAG TPA: peroxidase family protein [Longimicrobium sp.]|nr:peroxidase family protein [Longimicrobium sp.]
MISRRTRKMTRKQLGMTLLGLAAAVAVVVFLGFPPTDVPSCVELARRGFRPIADSRAERFQGKVQSFTGRCRGPESVERLSSTPWVDWSNYWAAGDASSRARYSFLPRVDRNGRGLDGALLDLEYQRLELIKFNLFDNYTYEEFVKKGGRARTRWAAMRLPPTHPDYARVGGAGEQVCRGELIRYRTLGGICNDIFNPLMGSSGTLFARNVQFEQTFPDLGLDSLARNRHGNRLGLLKPDPQVISRVLFTRPQSDPARCNLGQGLPGARADANCDYTPAPFFNVLAAFWIQFMTHDWFSHLEEGHNGSQQMAMGCAVAPRQAAALGCRPADRIDAAYIAQDTPAPRFTGPGGASLFARAPRTTRNNVTAWWDASQIYGYDDTSVRRVKRDPRDPAKLLMEPRGRPHGEGDRYGYLPLLAAGDPMNPQWQGQEAVAFPDNWSVGMSFYHNLFVREHNVFVDEFRKQAARTPDDDSGLRNPAAPARVIRYRDVSPEELYQAARLVVAAEIAKIHTVEWTTQLLYDEVLYRGMNANWHGLFRDNENLKRVTGSVAGDMNRSESEEDRTLWFSVFASGSGIVGLGNRREVKHGPLGLFPRDEWSIANPNDVNGGVNHFGSPFNFPEEFITVYRLHPLVPDLIEMRDYHHPNAIGEKFPVIQSFRGKATGAMDHAGLANWALSMGRQRLGALALQNHPAFLQNLPMPRMNSATNMVDVAALDIIRDRERGVPRFNEFRRQYGLRQLSSFDDFIDLRPSVTPETQQHQRRLVAQLRQIYGQHVCDSTRVITNAQLDPRGRPITDCLGHPNGTVVDNVEDVDMVVGWLAESTRPHGFAISETQFTVFILNASRRLFSDRFFTSSFRPEFYTKFGIDWVNNNGPTRMLEHGRPNGHREEVLPLKRVMLRTMPELAGELEHVVNVFDPWARDRGRYYSVEWKPREDARSDPAFRSRR